MLRRIRVLLVLSVLLAAAPSLPVHAQGGSATCPTLVATALEAVNEACADLGRDEACYGYNRVDATFWQPRADLSFSQPADRVPLLDLRTISTAPLDVEADRWGVAVLHVRANVPDTLPGQAVTFLLMGDATLENAVPPEQAAPPVTPVAATVTVDANLRSYPSTNANVVRSVPAGTALSLIGVNTAGDWYEAALEDGGTAWVFADLVAAEEAGGLEALPVSDEATPRYAPMQAFYFTAGLGEPACGEAPNALLVQSPQGVEVALRINDLDVQIGSTIIVTLTTIPSESGGTIPVMVVTLLQGTANILLNDQQIALEQPSWETPGALPVYAVTLNAEGRVDENSQVVTPPLDVVAPVVQNTCLNAMVMLERTDTQVCDSPLTGGFIAPQSTIPTGEADPLAGVGEDDACMGAPATTINLRGGPGTNYPLQGQITALEAAPLTGYADAPDGYRWWQVAGQDWVRGDLIRTAGNCAALGSVETPEPPVEPPPAPPGGGGGGGGNGTQVGLMWHLMACTYGEEAITNPVSFNWGLGCFDSPASASAHPHPAVYQLFVDGAPLDMSVLQQHGPENHAPICPWGWGFYYPAITLTPGEHTLTLNQTLTDSWQDTSGGGEAGSTNTMGCTINVVR